MTRGVLRTVLVVGSLAVILTLSFWWLRHHDREDSRREQQFHDSLTIYAEQSKQWQKIASDRTRLYQESTKKLDDLLRTPPKVVYVTRRATIDSGGLVDTSPPLDSTPYVPLTSYTALESVCSETRIRCDSLVAAKDSQLTKKTGEAKAADTLRAIAVRERDRERSRGKLRTVRDVTTGGGFVLLWCFLFGCVRGGH